MTSVLALATQSPEVDDSSDGGFQFSHPLFATTMTPARSIDLLSYEARAATSPVVVQSHSEEKVLMTPVAQPTYTRFGRRQPLGNRTLSSEGPSSDTPAQTTSHAATGKPTGSVARWKRTGRIGLGPPKRAERQSIDPELDGQAVNDEGGMNKENEPPIPVSTFVHSPKMALETTMNHRSSTSPTSLNRSGRSSHSEHSIDSHYSISSIHSQHATTNNIPAKEHLQPADGPPNQQLIHPINLHKQVLSEIASSIDRNLTSSASALPEQSSSEQRLHAQTSMLDPVLPPLVLNQNHVPISLHAVQKQVVMEGPSQASQQQQAAPPPPPKMFLDGPAPTAARKAKTLGRIVMNGREYTRLDQIGKGGSSKVFRVMAPNGKIFALKRVDFEQADQATIAGYKSEIDLLNRMSTSSGSDRIIKLFDSEINDAKGRLLMLMEAGEIDLAHMLTKRQNEPVDFNFIRLFWRHMLEAVQAVHEQKIVHSDLKPANFLLVEGSLKLIDFGIAKAIGNDTTNIHRDQQVGTVNYMSPEALSDTGGSGGRLMKLGRASDVWSLGCILYQMVYGRTPFSHLTMIQKIQAIPSPTHRIDFPFRAYPPSACNDKIKDETTARVVHGDLLRVMRGCLERDQTQRLTIEQLLRDPFLRPEEKAQRTEQIGSVAVNLEQITELLRATIAQTREKTLRRDTIQVSDMDNLAKDFFDRLRWAN